MIRDLKPYPAYKDSGVPWLGKVPEGWEVGRNGRLFAQRNQTGCPDLPILEVSLKTGVRIRDFEESSRKQMMSAKEKYKRACRGDLAYNMMRLWQGAVGMAPVEGLVSPAYIVARPLTGTNTRYFELLFRTPVYMRQVNKFSRGIVPDRNRMYWEDFKQMQSPAPPETEQLAIVRFLDYVDRRIRRYIRAKQKLIKLLEEQKQAIIHRAVTRGLDPNVRLKPSGVEWLGDVPEHWEVRPAKYFYREVDHRSATGGEELLSVSHISGVTPRSEKNITMFMASSYVGHKLCEPGDLVINTMWAWMGALGVARQRGIVSPSYAVYRPLRPGLLVGDYADLLLRTAYYVTEYVCRSTGIRSSRLRLYPEEFLRVRIVCPPVDEQRAILDYLSAQTAETRKAIGAAEREIQLLREYRTRLIADVVTGKLDAREAAARLPDEAEEPEAPEDAEPLAEDHESGEGGESDAGEEAEA